MVIRMSVTAIAGATRVRPVGVALEAASVLGDLRRSICRVSESDSPTSAALSRMKHP